MRHNKDITIHSQFTFKSIIEKINIHKTSRNFILGIKVEGYQYAAETASAGRPKHNKRVRKERWTKYCKMRVVSINLGGISRRSVFPTTTIRNHYEDAMQL
ncbi:hypothetical protein DID88_008923 [Monilinia fructigena]|uniref:Uncharacterized protein n=1 Tax=Monilinia fructigena TaxID=38457 RepID=A0A395JBV5_9HELO|nr:hypothetical protein DID88_008923 [Monilinia fructigena]